MDGEEYHLTPMGESDSIQKTTLSLLASQMTARNDVGIKAISHYGFRMIDKTFLFGPVAVFPKLTLSWRVVTPDDITEQSVEFFTLLEPKLDVVVIGVGDRKNLDNVRRRISPIFARNRIGMEILTTEDAVPIFNYLNAEGRYVAAGLYPPLEIKMSTEQKLAAIDNLVSLDEIDGGPMKMHLPKSFENVPNLIGEIWSGKSWKTDEEKKLYDANLEIKNRLLKGK